MKGLDRDDSAVIGFVVSCLFGQAIDREELRSWADHVMMMTDDHPAYIVDLSQFDGYLKDVFDVIGFVVSGDLTDEQQAAVAGIAYLRGKERYECRWTRHEALAELRSHPEILREFKEAFPFISLPPLERACGNSPSEAKHGT